MNDVKSVLLSKTIWGAVMMIAATVSLYFKVDLGDAGLWSEAAVGLFGSVFAIIGRVKAVKKIKLLP